MKLLSTLTALLLLSFWSIPAHAQDSATAAEEAADDADDDESDKSTLSSGDKVRYGVGLRLRYVFLPDALLEGVAVESSPAGFHNFGIGAEFIRRKGDFEINVGVEYESLSGNDGLWIDRGESIPANEVDLIEFDGFGWVTIDATFLGHKKLHDMVSLRYGGGIGIGFSVGDILVTDYACSDGDLVIAPGKCQQVFGAGRNDQTPSDKVWPVYPVINLVFGAQIRPTDDIAINIEAGFRTAPYLGTTIGYYFK